MAELEKRTMITLSTGAEVGAREAVALVESLHALLEIDPEEFQTLLALAEDRPGDAHPIHFRSLWAGYFLEKDKRTIRPAVREVLRACYQETAEGPVIVPLRLKDESSREVAAEAQERLDHWRRDFLTDPGRDKGNTRG